MPPNATTIIKIIIFQQFYKELFSQGSQISLLPDDATYVIMRVTVNVMFAKVQMFLKPFEYRLCSYKKREADNMVTTEERAQIIAEYKHEQYLKRKEYNREWHRQNKDKVRAINERYWRRRLGMEVKEE